MTSNFCPFRNGEDCSPDCALAVGLTVRRETGKEWICAIAAIAQNSESFDASCEYTSSAQIVERI